MSGVGWDGRGTLAPRSRQRFIREQKSSQRKRGMTISRFIEQAIMDEVEELEKLEDSGDRWGPLLHPEAS